MGVRFRFRFNGPDGGRVFRLYEPKWRPLMAKVFELPKSRETYEDLSQLRRAFPQKRGGPTIQTYDVMGPLARINEDGAKALLNVSPLFNITPYDFQTFILVQLGLRAEHFSPPQAVT